MNIITTLIRYSPLTLLIVASCAPVGPGGSGTETTTGIVGAVVDNQGRPQANVQVKLLHATHDPVRDTNAIPADTTDSLGAYRFMLIDSGDYSLQMVHLIDRTRAYISGIHVAYDTVNAAPAMVHTPGSINVALPKGINGTTGYVYIPGTTFFTSLDGRTEFVILDSLPAGQIPAIAYSSTDQPAAFAIRYDISVASGETAVVLNPSWKYAQTIGFNTTPSGVNVASDVANFPVLIRLHAGNFDFSQAQRDGSDVRFTNADDSPLSHEIERWNTAGKRAEIWVKVDTVYGNDTTQAIIMYWGNAAAVDSSNSTSVFDTADGYQGVWHLAEAGNTTAIDATVNDYNGTPVGMSAASAVEGIIGGAQVFDGVASCYTMANTAAGALNFPENGPYTVSAWIYIDTLDSTLHTIVSKGNRQYSLGAVASNEWEFSTCPEGGGWDVTNGKATEKTWTHLVGVRNGSRQYLYVDGVCADSTVANLFSGITRFTGDDMAIGKCPNDSLYFFKGIIDEVSVSGVARDPVWIKLSYMNQQMVDKFITFR